MKISLNQFDTSVLSQNVYTLILEESDNRSNVQKHLTEINNGIICSFVSVQPKYTKILQSSGFNLISLRNTYLYSNKEINLHTPIDKDLSIQEYTSGLPINSREIEKFAELIGNVNRYYKDDEIPKEKSKKVYVEWINNSLYHRFAEKTFFAFHNNTPIGICTTRIHDNMGRIDLFGILPEFQGKKIGKHLLTEAIDFLQKINSQEIFVVTAGENLRANAFFQKNHFVIKSTELVYHKHICS